MLRQYSARKTRLSSIAIMHQKTSTGGSVVTDIGCGPKGRGFDPLKVTFFSLTLALFYGMEDTSRIHIKTLRYA